MPPPSSAAPIRLRQWFDDAAQLQHHFHRRTSDEVLLFAGPQLPRGAPVLLEVGFRDCEQTCILRGRADDAEQGGAPGTWLSFTTGELVKGLVDAAAVRRRRAQRVPTELVVNARADRTVYVCKLVDVSLGGARLTGLRGVVRPGMELVLTTFGRPPQLGGIDSAVLVWQSGLDAGVRFLRREPAARQALSRLVAEAKQGWASALEARHPPQCRCLFGLGRTWEPPAPKERARMAG